MKQKISLHNTQNQKTIQEQKEGGNCDRKQEMMPSQAKRGSLPGERRPTKTRAVPKQQSLQAKAMQCVRK